MGSRKTEAMFRGFGSIFYKEVIQISRDPLTLALMLMLPMLQLLIFGYAINTTIRDVRTAVYNLDPGRDSRELLDAFENTDYFQITEYAGSDEELNKAIVAGRAKVGIKIPPDYSERLASNRQATVLVLIDGSDSSIATQSLTVSTSVGLRESLERLTAGGEGGSPDLPIEIRPKMLFNPDSRSANFMVPGLVAIILQVITTLLTAFSIVRERERGTLEQLLVTPIQPFGLMLGKLVPYGLIGIFETVTVLAVMRVIFDVPINGSVLLLLLLSILFLFTALAIGLLISTKAQNQVQAFQMAFLIIFPSVLLSGFMFPRASMPAVMQAISFLIPATHFMEIIRGIVLRGATISDVMNEVITLAVMGLLLLALSALRFRKKLA
ncbi:MAG TPA: ABC transporter permease [Blastocatellia bacterium]|nr:ABC transporter permease [Blastocatellia bacterium]